MACRTETCTIGNRPVHVVQWAAKPSLENLNKAMRVFNNAFFAFVGDEKSPKFYDFCRLLQGEDEVTDLIREFVKCARVDGVEVIDDYKYNEVYNHDLFFLYQVFCKACEVQYGDFFASGQEEMEQYKRSQKAQASQTSSQT